MTQRHIRKSTHLISGNNAEGGSTNSRQLQRKEAKVFVDDDYTAPLASGRHPIEAHLPHVLSQNSDMSLGSMKTSPQMFLHARHTPRPSVTWPGPPQTSMILSDATVMAKPKYKTVNLVNMKSDRPKDIRRNPRIISFQEWLTELQQAFTRDLVFNVVRVSVLFLIHMISPELLVWIDETFGI
nr:uncharacterized protein LOC128688826 isoform X2 [Cherax quadricarinatus]